MLLAVTYVSHMLDMLLLLCKHRRVQENRPEPSRYQPDPTHAQEYHATARCARTQRAPAVRVRKGNERAMKRGG
jgi:hypothetical protein